MKSEKTGTKHISAALLAAASLKPDDEREAIRKKMPQISAALLAAASLKHDEPDGKSGNRKLISAALLAAASLKRQRRRRAALDVLISAALLAAASLKRTGGCSYRCSWCDLRGITCRGLIEAAPDLRRR